jgi:hypothetical protein
MKKIRTIPFALGLTILFLALTTNLTAQELEPRAFAAAPVKMNIFLLGYAYSNGNVLLDKSIPIEDGKAEVNSFALAYVTTVNIFGKLAKLDVAIPFSFGNWEGLVLGQPASTTRTGFGDPAVRLGINLIGTPALYGRDFLTFRERFVLGTSLQVRLPLGQYYEDKVINLGANRWMFRPNIGAGIKLGRWIIEASLSAWFFTRNSQFILGETWQEPIFAAQMHLAYNFRRGFWLAASFGKSRGGKTIVNDIPLSDVQNNTRYGLTLAVPISGGHAVTLSFSSGIVTRYGTDFDTFACSYSYRWASR